MAAAARFEPGDLIGGLPPRLFAAIEVEHVDGTRAAVHPQEDARPLRLGLRLFGRAGEFAHPTRHRHRRADRTGAQQVPPIEIEVRHGMLRGCVWCSLRAPFRVAAALARLMIEQEFGAVEQHPEHVRQPQ